LVNLLLNKLPHCYEDVIQNLSTMDVMPSWEDKRQADQ
jgi:hypothetical protein